MFADVIHRACQQERFTFEASRCGRNARGVLNILKQSTNVAECGKSIAGFLLQVTYQF
jgi:hypothetical protein